MMQVRLYKKNNFKDGGPLRKHAESVRQAGRHEDDFLVHVNEKEFEQMRQMWGDPLINPNTGVPEWGFMDSLKKVLKKALPVLGIASAVIPGLQFLSPLATLSKGIGAATGLGSAASNALAGATIGGVTGGKRGAIAGGIGGFAGAPTGAGEASPVQSLGSKIPGFANASPELQSAIGRGLLGAGSAKVMNQDPLTGAVTAASIGGMTDRLGSSDIVTRGMGPALQQGALGALKGAELAALTGGDYRRGAVIGGASGAANAAVNKYLERQAYLQPEFVGPQNPQLQSPTDAMITQMTSDPTFTTTPDMFGGFSTKQEALAAMGKNPDQRDVYDALESFNVCDLSSDFGSCIAQNWDSFMGNLRKRAPTINLKCGGPLSRVQMAVGGPGDGQDDLIQANLSDGEFVIPADVVSALGSGSTDAGSEALYQMIEGVRNQYRSAPNDKIPPKALSPLAYMRGV